ncbi:VPS34 [Sanghuangporus weigelae]
MDKDNPDFTFAKSSSLKLPVTFRISQFEGNRKPRPFTDIIDNPDLQFSGLQTPGFSDLYVTCQLVADNKPLTIPFRTAFKAFKNSYMWNEWITLPIRYCDLPLSSQITFTVWDIEGPRSAAPVGGTTFRLFGKKRTLRRGKHRLYLWQGTEADGSVDTKTPSKMEMKDEMGRLEKLVKKYERGDMPKEDWLDKLAFRKMEEIHAAEAKKSKDFFLYIDLPRFDFPVVFSEPEPTNLPTIISATSSPQASVTPVAGSLLSDSSLWQIVDPEVGRDNPVEDKHRRLIRSQRSGVLDRELKPNAKDRDELAVILNYPPTQPLTSEEKDLVWKFRFYLTRDKRGLTKFLKSVTWRDPSEVKQAVEVLLPLWTDIEVDDALELLGPGTVDSRVRNFAVKQLSKADDDELLLYLLQLLQALKFESSANEQRSMRLSTNAISQEDSGLADFLIDRSVRNPVLGNRFHWYLMVEVALEDKQVAKVYGKVWYKYMEKLKKSDDGVARTDVLRRQGELISTLAKKAKELKASKDQRPKKIERLRAFIADSKNGLLNMAPLPLPLDAAVEVTGIVPEKASVFKSSLSPMLLYFTCTDGSEYPLIFKDGDDMRQDQLVIQLFTLMDRLLRKENLDLKVSPYAVLATSPSQGMAQFIPSMAIATIVSEYNGSLLNYLRAHNPDEGSVGTFGVKKSVLDTFVRSCAGYSVMTYILGVGDRHLDNLLLAPDGHFFHVDFGYILGHDPKPYPPPVKVCPEMIEAMGGTHSPEFARFQNLCFVAYTILRKSANLILNLVSLMGEANIPHVNYRDVHEQLQEKFQLHLSEEEAIKELEKQLRGSSTYHNFLDRMHGVAQYWRY